MPKDEKDNVEEKIDKSEIVENNPPKINTKTIEGGILKSNTTVLVVCILVSLLLAGAIVTVVGSIASNNSPRQQGRMTFYSRQSEPRMHQVYIQSSTETDDSNSIMISGVVKSVSGNSFVIAGNGNQTTVNTTGDTTYNTTDKKVSVNDSVIVIGTSSNSIVTATDVRISNF